MGHPSVRRRDSGLVTAETAVVLPFVIAVAFALVWVVSLGVTQVRLVDATREAARMSARGDDPSKVRAAAEQMAPDGAQISLDADGGPMTTVRISVEEQLALPLLDQLPPVRLEAEAVSANEGKSVPDTPERGPP